MIGTENVLSSGGRFFLRAKPDSLACIFLDEERKQCALAERMPSGCRTYNCVGEDFELLIQEVRHELQRRGQS